MKITVTVDLNDELVNRIYNGYHDDYGVTKEEVVKVVTEFLQKEVGTESGLLMLIEILDLFNY